MHETVLSKLAYIFTNFISNSCFAFDPVTLPYVVCSGI